MKQSLWLCGPFTALVLVACSAPTVDEICERIGECPDADADTVAECKQDANAFADDAIADGCQDQLDAYLTCIADEDLCNEDTLEHGCAAEGNAVEDCESQSEDDPPEPG